MKSSLVDELTPEYRTFDDVLRSLGRLQEIFYEQRDRRAVFLTALLIASGEAKSRTLSGGFLDCDWAARCVVAFANLYRAALLACEKEDYAAVPSSWRTAFDAANNNADLTIQDLWLGINAHVNHDLPFALTVASMDPGREQRYRDHASLNELLRASANRVEDRLQAVCAPSLDLLGRAFHPIVSDIASFDLGAAGQFAWDNAAALTDARSETERASIARRIEDHSDVVARLILAPAARRLVLDALRRVEAVSPWWRFVALPDLDAGRSVRVVEQPLAVSSLDELVGRLNTIVERYDARCSRMSIDPAAYLAMCGKLKAALAEGTFEDAEWITRLNLYLGTFYLNAVTAFDAGKLEEIPDCWIMAFQAATTGGDLLLQDLLMALSARLNYDLARALLLAGMEEPARNRRRPDFEKLHGMLCDHIVAVEEQMVNKYSRAELVPSLLAGPLQGILGEFLYDRSLEAAWNNATSLADAASNAELQKLLLDLDRKAGAVAQRILLKGLPEASWVILALRHIENEFGDAWSRWLE